MKVEQRIGRIDRIGQVYPKVRVINLAYKDTIEADVYFALSRRIKLFEGIVGKLQPILSRLPKEFERVSLERAEHREAAQARLRANVDKMQKEAEETAFDIDEAAQEALELLELPVPALSLEDLDAAVNMDAVRPAGWEWERLDPGSYAVGMPGMPEKVRATTNAEVFDNHFESHAFLSPGGFLFDRLFEEDGTLTQPTEDLSGQCWLALNKKANKCRLILHTADGFACPETLGQLLSNFSRIGPANLPPPTPPDETVVRLF